MAGTSWYNNVNDAAPIETEFDGKTYWCRKGIWYDQASRRVDSLLAHRLTQQIPKPNEPLAEPKPKVVYGDRALPPKKAPTSSNPDPNAKFLEFLFARFADSLAQSSLARFQGTRWILPALWEFIRIADPVVSTSFEPIAPTPMGQFLGRLASWESRVEADKYFCGGDRDSAENLLELLVLIVAQERYGGWQSASDLEPMDFTTAYLRSFAEAKSQYDEHVCSMRLGGIVRGWECLEPPPDQLEHFNGLVSASSFGGEILAHPSAEKWTSFVSSLPSSDADRSWRMKQYLLEARVIADELCDLWDSERAIPGESRSCPPFDIAEAAIAAVRGRLSADRFQRYLELGDPLRRRSKTGLRWEVLPPGWWRDSSRQAILSKLGNGGTGSRIWLERFEFLDSLEPLHCHCGLLGKDRTYFVFEFEHLAVAECAIEGNAIYLVDKRKCTWESILALTKQQALRSGATRIFHDNKGEWQRKLAQLVGADSSRIQFLPQDQPVRSVNGGNFANTLAPQTSPPEPEEPLSSDKVTKAFWTFVSRQLSLYSKRQLRASDCQSVLRALEPLLREDPDPAERLNAMLSDLRLRTEELKNSGLFSEWF